MKRLALVFILGLALISNSVSNLEAQGAFAQQSAEPAAELGSEAGAASESLISEDLEAVTESVSVLSSPNSATGPAYNSPSRSPIGFDLLWPLGAFVLVLLVLYLVLKGLGRLGRFRGGNKGRNALFQLRGIQALDQRKYLAAVEIQGRMLVVAVSGERISPVAHWLIEQEAEDDNLAFKSFNVPDFETENHFELLDDDDDGPSLTGSRGPRK